jgi:outer membrane protein TolC
MKIYKSTSASGEHTKCSYNAISFAVRFSERNKLQLFSRPRLKVEKSESYISDGMGRTYKRTMQKIVFAFLLIGSWTIANCQQSDSLKVYLELAAKNNPTVMQKFIEYKAALQKIPQVGSLPDPALNLGVFLSPMELVNGNQVADIRLMQMFPWFGLLKAAKDEMSLMAKAKYESFRDAKLQVFYDLQQAWFEIYKVQQDLRISEKNMEILSSLERLSIVRFKAASSGGGSASSSGGAMKSGAAKSASSGSSGMNTMGGNSGTTTAKSSPTPSMQSSPMGSSGGSGLSDLYRIQIEIAELKNNIALLKNQQNTIVARFNSFLNRPVQSPVAVSDTLKPDALNIPLLAVSDSMLLNNPMLGMLNYEKKSLEARKVMVTKMGYPMVGLGVNYSLINKNPMATTSAMNGKDMVMPMLAVTLPIYRKKYKAMIDEAELLKTATVQGIQAAANSLQAEYYVAVQNYLDAQRRMGLYVNQYQLANQSLNILMKSFSASGAGLIDVLRVRQQTLDYELKQVDAVADFNSAIAKLQRLMAYSRIQ